MPEYSLVPVDHQPDFDDYSLVPVDYDPFAEDGLTQQAQIRLAQAQPQQQPPAGAGQPDAAAPAAGGSPGGSDGGGTRSTGEAFKPLLDQGAAKTAPFGGYADPAPTPSNGVLYPLGENGVFDSYAYVKNLTGTPPAGPQVTTVNGNVTVTATGDAKHTNAGGVYGRTLTLSEPGSDNLATFTAADPTGLLVATPVEGKPDVLSVREYKGY